MDGNEGATNRAAIAIGGYGKDVRAAGSPWVAMEGSGNTMP